MIDLADFLKIELWNDSFGQSLKRPMLTGPFGMTNFVFGTIYPASRYHRNRYVLRWDYNTCNSDIWDRACRLRGNAINRVIFNSFKISTSSKKASFFDGLLSGEIQGLTLEEARKNAAVLFKIVDSAVHGGLGSNIDAAWFNSRLS